MKQLRDIKSAELWWLGIRALLCAFVVNASIAFEIVRNRGAVLVMPADISTYLHIAMNVGEKKGGNYFYLEHQHTVSLWESLREQPNNVVNVVVGRTAVALGFSEFQLFLLLGLLSFSLAYLHFALLIGSLTGMWRLGELSSVIFLLFDSVNLPARIALPESDPLLRQMSALRPVYTEVSYIFFPLVILYVCRCICLSPASCWRHSLAGLFTALTFYIYVYCYLTLCAVCGIFYLLYGFIGNGADNRPRNLLGFACYVLSAGIFALPGLMIVPYLSSSQPALVRQAIASVWPPISWQEFTVVAVLSPVFFMSRYQQKYRALAGLLLAAAVAGIILPYLQPVLKQILQPFKFLSLYLNSFQQALVVALIFFWLENEGFKKILWTGRACILLSLIYIGIADVYASGYRTPLRSEQRSFMMSLREAIAPGSVVAALTIQVPFIEEIRSTFPLVNTPESLALWIDGHVLHEVWSRSVVSVQEELSRELLLGWLFSGRVQYTWPCQRATVELPGDLLTLTWTEYRLHRVAQRETCEQVQRGFSLCQAVKEYRVDYLFEDRTSYQVNPAHISRFSAPIVTSSNGHYKIYQIDRGALEQVACDAEGAR